MHFAEDHTAHIARKARLRWLWLRTEQMDLMYDVAIGKGNLVQAMRYARWGAQASRKYLEG